MMRTILIDDEALAVSRLATGLSAIPDVTIVATALDARTGIDLIEHHRPDLVFLDIEMPEMNGIALAERLAAMPDPPEIVFVTAFDRYAAQAFEVDAADYLLKPVSGDRLRMGIARALRRRNQRDLPVDPDKSSAFERADSAPDKAGGFENTLWVPVRQGSILLPVSSINVIEAAKDYVLLHTEAKSHILRAKMSDLEHRLDPTIMLRVHRSYMVRVATVTGVERPGRGTLRLKLSDESVIQVGPVYIDEVIQALGLATFSS